MPKTYLPVLIFTGAGPDASVVVNNESPKRFLFVWGGTFSHSKLSRGNKGRFCKRAILATVPSFRFWVPGTSTITAFFCQGSTAGKDFLEEISVQGNICQNHPFGNHPFANPQTWGQGGILPQSISFSPKAKQKFAPKVVHSCLGFCLERQNLQSCFHGCLCVYQVVPEPKFVKGKTENIGPVHCVVLIQSLSSFPLPLNPISRTFQYCRHEIYG